jgi:hypothetical protein
LSKTEQTKENEAKQSKAKYSKTKQNIAEWSKMEDKWRKPKQNKEE